MAMARYTYHGLSVLRTSLPKRTFATKAFVTPPQAAADQIFRDEQLSRLGTSLGTEDEWQEAVKAQEQESGEDDHHEGSDMEVDNASLFASNRLGQVVLPTPLIGSVNAMLKHSHGPGIRSTALRFYESLRSKSKGKTPETPMPPSKEFTSTECVAYIAGLMPQVYTSVYITLLELRKRLGEEWRPATVLDCGVGPGTAALAFQEVFVHSHPQTPDPLPKITIIEVNDELRHRTEKLWSGMKAFQEEEKYSTDRSSLKIYHTMGSDSHKYDVVLAPHVLGDQKGRPSARDVLVRELWNRVAPGGVLLLLERGNPMGFEQVARARQLILKNANQDIDVDTRKKRESGGDGGGAHVISPCPHDGACPMFLHGHDPDRRSWCHFSQRLQRPDFLQRTKHARENIEDVNYSHVILRKGSRRPPFPSSSSPSLPNNDIKEGTDGGMSRKDIVSASYHWSRIILPPLKRHKHVLLDICSSPLNVLVVADPTLTEFPRITKHSKKTLKLKEQQGEESSEVSEARPILQRTTVPKSQGQLEYRFARRSHWGDLLPFRGKTMIDKRVNHQAVAAKQDIKKDYRREVKERQRERREARESTTVQID